MSRLYLAVITIAVMAAAATGSWYFAQRPSVDQRQTTALLRKMSDQLEPISRIARQRQQTEAQRRRDIDAVLDAAPKD